MPDVSPNRKHLRTWRRYGVQYVEAVTQPILGLPRCQPFLVLKRFVLRLSGAKLGRRITIYPDVWVFPGRDLVLGDDVDLARGVLITTSGGVTIGDRTLVGYGTHILSGNHVVPPARGRIIEAGHSTAPIHVGSDCWIGAQATILPGVTIGDGAVVAAGSVVVQDVADYEVVAGVPARVVRVRAPDR